VDKKWLVNRTNQDFLDFLSNKISISAVLAQILVNRGFKDPESIYDFLHPSIEKLHDPFLMQDMEIAVERIKKALAGNEKVLVYGDYDTDGLTSTALLVHVLRNLGVNTGFLIPNRITDGYGLKIDGVQKAKSLGVDLIITVDCGISSEEEISIAGSLGIDVIVTDHHEPPDTLPRAVAILNPHRASQTDKGKEYSYPFRYLAGVGVAFKLAQALLTESSAGKQGRLFEDMLELAAIGTIADSVPLTGENRIIVTHGLIALNSNESRPWVHAIKEASGLHNKEFYSTMLSYTVIPRINAVGRLGDPNGIVEFFLTQDADIAKETAQFIDNQNKKRQKIEEEVFKSALDMIDTDNPDSIIVLNSSEWHPGVLGIVSSRLVEMFYRPSILFSVKNDIAKGSARSIPPFHIYKGLSECSGLLLNFGGHRQAAGLSLTGSGPQPYY
jgi:single-stranded-DNA-specific exonuclease